jgi:hypothetical protein
MCSLKPHRQRLVIAMSCHRNRCTCARGLPQVPLNNDLAEADHGAALMHCPGACTCATYNLLHTTLPHLTSQNFKVGLPLAQVVVPAGHFLHWLEPGSGTVPTGAYPSLYSPFGQLIALLTLTAYNPGGTTAHHRRHTQLLSVLVTLMTLTLYAGCSHICDLLLESLSHDGVLHYRNSQLSTAAHQCLYGVEF